MPREITRSRRVRDEDGGEQERPTRRSRRVADDEHEDERPARRSRRSRDEEDRPRRSRDREERGERRSSGGGLPTNVGRGRASVRRHRETHQAGDFAPKFTVGKESVLIRFIDEDWFFTYYEHWINEFRGQKRQMSFVCWGDDCPLCDIGDDPKFTALINVIDLSDPDDPQVKVWYATPNPIGAVEDRMDDPKSSPINAPEYYFEVSKKQQQNKFTSYSVDRVKARDLEEDWDMEPLTADEIADLAAQRYTEDDCVRITPRRDMQAVADELEGND